MVPISLYRTLIKLRGESDYVLNEIADALNNRRIQWDRLESKLMICNREKCNCFSNEEMGFSLETKYGGVMEEVENMSRLLVSERS